MRLPLTFLAAVVGGACSAAAAASPTAYPSASPGATAATDGLTSSLTTSITADWLSAIGTVGALFVALVLLAFQNVDRRRDAFDRRRAHAVSVAAAFGREEKLGTPSSPMTGRTWMSLFNRSDSPVYSLVVGIVGIQGTVPRTLEAMIEYHVTKGSAPPATVINILPPGTFEAWIDGIGWTSAMGGRPAAEVAFTDRAGRHWIRRATGELSELPDEPISYFESRGLRGPHGFQQPTPVP